MKQKLIFSLPLGEEKSKKILVRAIRNAVCKDTNDFPLALSEEEQSELEECMEGATNYLEFGAGASTFLAVSHSNISTIYSVESDKNWIKYLLKWKYLRSEHNKRLFFCYANIGKTGMWGAPLEQDKMHLYPNYSRDIYKNMLVKPDLVFIDGRFRVACVLQTIMNVGQECKILVHDYTIRDEYKVIEKYVDVINTAGTLAEFTIKTDIDMKEVENIYLKYMYNPD